MDIEICRNCPNRKVFYIISNEKYLALNHSGFYCMKEDYINTFKMYYSDIKCYVLKDKWKNFFFSLFNSVWLKLDKQKYLNELFKKTDVNDIHFVGFYDCQYKCEQTIQNLNRN